MVVSSNPPILQEEWRAHFVSSGEIGKSHLSPPSVMMAVPRDIEAIEKKIITLKEKTCGSCVESNFYYYHYRMDFRCNQITNWSSSGCNWNHFVVLWLPATAQPQKITNKTHWLASWVFFVCGFMERWMHPSVLFNNYNHRKTKFFGISLKMTRGNFYFQNDFLRKFLR